MNILALAAVVSLAIVLAALGLIRYLRLRAAQDADEEVDALLASLRRKPAGTGPESPLEHVGSGVQMGAPPPETLGPQAVTEMPADPEPQVAGPPGQTSVGRSPAAPDTGQLAGGPAAVAAGKTRGESRKPEGLDAIMLDTFRPIAEDAGGLPTVVGQMDQVDVRELVDLAKTVSGELRA